MRTSRHLAIVLFGLASMATSVSATNISFNRDVRPILSRKCFTCHGPDDATREAGLRLDDRQIATHPLESGNVAVVPGDPAESELIARIREADEVSRMPPAEFGARLSEQESMILSAWIEAGATYDTHWAYVPPKSPAIPPVSTDDKSWPTNEIDHFTLSRMRDRNLEPSPDAGIAILARRVYLDLTGLPPTPDEVARIRASRDPRAYERLVDDLLSRPSFGEHWARQWLDLARYADSAGYADDPPRTIWPYRDWVIRALNANLSFDQFTIEQLAGDLLPNPTEDQRIATAFHRNTLTNNEGGTIDEEFRNVAVVDRVNTTLAVWMGTTLACAQCHNHKYDPFSQEDYFRVFAIFNNTEDADRPDEAPILPMWSHEELAKRSALESRLAQLRSAADTPAETLSAAEKEWTQFLPRASVPILSELVRDRRLTRIQRRGNYLDLGDQVSAGVPHALGMPGRSPPGDRLSFAQWLVHKDNPLTARVVVNRFWEALFGRGIVGTCEDFGTQGDLPTHPELLDWLAVEFMESGWDVKALLYRIVTSATYRQSSEVTAERFAADVDNRWLARGPRVRLSAEMVRDQALAVSGLLSPKMFGPPVRPPQPNLGLAAAFGGSTDWNPSEGDDRYRRAVYTVWRRSNPYPSMATFDAPNREVCTIRRSHTNTPLQSLVTLNDPTFVEAAQALARSSMAVTSSAADQIRLAFQRCLLREPTPEELASLNTLYSDTRVRLSKSPDESRRLATEPLGPLPENCDAVDAATMTVIGNVLLNLDEMFMKR